MELNPTFPDGSKIGTHEVAIVAGYIWVTESKTAKKAKKWIEHTFE